MRLSYENRNEEVHLDSLKEFVSAIEAEIQRMGEHSIMSIRDKFIYLLAKYGLTYVDLSGGRSDFVGKVKAFSPEINFVIDQERARLDPGWEHLLMSKRIYDMTGYEYKAYLELIGKASA